MGLLLPSPPRKSNCLGFDSTFGSDWLNFRLTKCLSCPLTFHLGFSFGPLLAEYSPCSATLYDHRSLRSVHLSSRRRRQILVSPG